jgi:hypothetical protein
MFFLFYKVNIFNYIFRAGNSTLDYTDGGPMKTAGLDPFQIVLIVVCVSLAIGLLVALIVLLKYGR